MIISLFETVRLSVSISPRNLYNSLKSIKEKKVLLLEAGGHYDENPNFRQLIYWLSLQHTEHDWEYFTDPQEFSNLGITENRAFWPRGRVLGGSATINAGQYTNGSKYDFNEWANNGCSGWSYKDVLPYFLKSEDIQIDELKTSKYHFTGGPIAVSGGRATPIADRFIQAGQEMVTISVITTATTKRVFTIYN